MKPIEFFTLTLALRQKDCSVWINLSEPAGCEVKEEEEQKGGENGVKGSAV